MQNCHEVVPQESEIYDVIVIGAGASGSALLYTLATYTNLKKMALVEKYAKAGQVNSRSSNNSQTLHVGDIETNYSLEKVKQVYPAAMMVARYGEHLDPSVRGQFLFPTKKMVLAVGSEEVASLEKRYQDLKPIFPELKKLSREEISKVEPAVVEGRSEQVPLLGLYTDGYAVDFERLAQILIERVQQARPDVDVFFSHTVKAIEKSSQGYTLFTNQGKTLHTKSLVVNADSYSLLMAKQLGYGKEFSLIPIAGSFYFSRQMLNGKVYTVQEPKLPFAAVHGDPDIHANGETRWGPTARFYPVLEARNFKTSLDFLRSSGLNRLSTWMSFAKILLDPIRFKYLLENMLYELPWIGKRMFLKNVRKIVPMMKASDVRMAKGYGGMRLQRVDTHKRELLLGEGKILGDKVIFNMAPSPGASVCLYNAMRDTETVMSFLGECYTFDKARMQKDLYVPIEQMTYPVDVSLKEAYAS